MRGELVPWRIRVGHQFQIVQRDGSEHFPIHHLINRVVNNQLADDPHATIETAAIANDDRSSGLEQGAI